jgi:hypothetical protein
MRPSVLVCLIVPLACLAGCLNPPVYQVQRSVRAPRATVPLRTGQPLAGPVELTVGASNAANLSRPKLGDENAAVEVPTYQGRGELRVRLAKNGELALIHERGVGDSAIKLDSTQAPIGEGSPHGTGFAVRYAAPTEHLVIGIEMELMAWSLPYVEYRTCVENCEFHPQSQQMMIDRGTATKPTFGFGLTPSYQHGNLTLFGGAFARNHPTIERKGTEISSFNDEDVSQGPLNLLLHAGAAYRFGGWLTAMLVINQDLIQDPVRYGPGLGFALSAALK